MRRLTALAWLLCSCGAFRTPYPQRVLESPAVSAGDLLREVESHPSRAEAHWRGKLVRVEGLVQRITVAERLIGRSHGLSSCADIDCAGATRNAHSARIATAVVVAADGQAGTIECEFSEQRFAEAALLDPGGAVVVGGKVKEMTTTESGPRVQISGCTMPREE